MAVIKISEMTDAILLQDNDYVPILQNGLNKKVKVELLRDYDKLHNKPIINGVTVEHNKTITDYNVVKENQGIQINEDKKTLELETLGSIEIENRADVNKAITIKTADKTAKETAHQTMSKEYRPNDQAHLSEGENQPVSYKAVKEYVDTLEAKVDVNERDIEDKVQKLDEKTTAKDSELESLITTNEQDIEQKYTALNQKVEQNKQTTDNEIQQLKSKDSELKSLISTNEEDIESKVQELDNKKLNKEAIPKTLPNPYALTFTGAVSGIYDGSSTQTINIPNSSGGTGDINNAQVTFTEAEERTNIESQETMSTIFGKIKKWFSDLKTVAFTGSYDDLLNKPDIPTKTSELTNDSDFLTAIPEEYITDTELEEKGFAKTSDIPSKLPNPNKLIFTGAVSGEYDGSAPLSIEIPQGGGGGTVEKEWQLIKEITLEEETAYIQETLDSEYKEIILIYENLWSSNKTGIGVAISFNGNSTESTTTSFSTGTFVNSEQFPSQGFFEVKFLPNGCTKVIGAGINSGSNRGSASNNIGYMTKDQMKNLDYINKVNFSLEAYGTNRMNVGAKFYIYGR